MESDYTNMDEYVYTQEFFGSVSDYIPGFVNYVEGIYIGYRFYETAAAEGLIDYDKVVQYPFGYGLSYTSFKQEMGPISVSDDTISFDVTVTNTGSTASKDVVEVYVNPPYTNGGIEKATANLIQFGKTGMLEPGASETVKISFPIEDMMAYDYQNNQAYVLEAGDYIISINTDSHNIIDSQTYTVASTTVYGDGNKRASDLVVATNQFDYANGDVTYLSRANGFANYAEATAAPSNFEMLAESKDTFYNISNYLTAEGTASDEDPNAPSIVTGNKQNVKLETLRGVAKDDPAWDTFMDQLTLDEMNGVISLGGYQTAEIESVSKIRTNDCDGPASINNNFTGVGSIGFPVGVVIAATWNQDLAYDFGESIGKMANEMDVSGWYAPAMNIHRFALSGRNFEYYSEDPIISAYIAANAVKGSQDKRCGVGVFFEKENTNTLYMDNEMILTFMMSQAQSESESLSTNVKWGFRKRFANGVVYYHYDTLLGYRKGSDGEPEIDPEEAAVVRRIFARYLMGQSFQQICDGLMEDGIKTAPGSEKWYGSTVKSILQNEKYIGDAVLQKTLSEDLFERQRVKNEGQLPKYYVHDCHPAIIDRVTFQRVQEELARRSSLRKTSSKTKTEQGKHSGKYVLSGLLVCSECGSPYRRVLWMPNGEKRYVWRCINRLEHGRRICKHSATLEEPELHAAVTAAMNEMFQQRTAREMLTQCVAAALAGKENGDLTLPAVETRLRALQKEQLDLLQLAMCDTSNTEYDERLTQINSAISGLLARKTELAREGRTDTKYDSRVQAISDTLENTTSAIEGFDDGMVYQTVSSIKVLERDRLSIRFKDGTEIEQEILERRRASA